jgi:hypothetical protein
VPLLAVWYSGVLLPSMQIRRSGGGMEKDMETWSRYFFCNEQDVGGGLGQSSLSYMFVTVKVTNLVSPTNHNQVHGLCLFGSNKERWML